MHRCTFVLLCIHINAYICIYIYIHIHMYIYIHIQNMYRHNPMSIFNMDLLSFMFTVAHVRAIRSRRLLLQLLEEGGKGFDVLCLNLKAEVRRTLDCAGFKRL